MAITFHADGRVTGNSASNFGASGQVLQSVTKMGTACYNMTQTSFTELSTDFRVTLSTVRSANTKILILFSSKMRHASHATNITKQYRPAFRLMVGVVLQILIHTLFM